MKKLYLFFLTPLFLYSQNLEELVNLSIQNKLVDSSLKSIDAIKDEYRSVKSSYLPSLDVGAGHSFTDNETASVAKNSSKAYASLSYTLYDGGKKFDTYDAFESTIKSADESLLALKNNIALNVINNYYNYFSNIAKKEAKIKEIEQLDSQVQRLSRFLDAGTTTEDEVQKIISRLENAKVILQEIELNMQTIIYNLEYIAGEKIDIENGSSIKGLENEISNNLRFDLRAIEFDLQTKLSNSKAEKSASLPNISIDNTYTYYDKNYDGNYSTDVDKQNILSANLRWNIFSFEKTKYRYESKYKEYLSLRSKYEYEKDKATSDLKLAIKAYDISKLKIKSAQANLNAANSTYDIIKSKYENGLVDNVAFLESLSEKFSAISQMKTSLNELEIKKANILYHSGKKLQEYIK